MIKEETISTNSYNLKDKAFEALIEDEDAWVIDKYTAYHKPSGISWWIGSGLIFFHNDGRKDVSISLRNWFKLYFWIKNVKRKRVIRSVYS